jgi:hypothetical protein
MITEDQIIENVSRGRCVRSGRILAGGEFILSKKEFPGLYDGEICDKEREYIGYVLEAVEAIVSMNRCSIEEREVLRCFLTLVLSCASVQERTLQVYLSSFWNEIPGTEQIRLSESYREARADKPGTPFAREVLPRIRSFGERTDAWIDIVGLGGRNSSELFLIEVKRGELDDRAVGQILRYYHATRLVCDREQPASIYIQRITPVLVVRGSKLDFWTALPIHFRELLYIFFYEASRNGEFRLRDGRLSLEREARGRLYTSSFF